MAVLGGGECEPKLFRVFLMEDFGNTVVGRNVEMLGCSHQFVSTVDLATDGHASRQVLKVNLNLPGAKENHIQASKLNESF